MQYYKPNKRYKSKLLISFTVLTLIILIGISIFSGLISLDDRDAGLIIFLILAIPDLLFWIIAIVLSAPYFRSLSYEIHKDEVIVHVGILTKSIKHVPYRTVTNLSIKRDILDCWFFKLGSLNIQTAGMSGQTGAEEQLVGLENVDEVYQLVAQEIRRFRGGMSPTQSHDEASPDNYYQEILDELKKIRIILEKE
jgi:membrane protein YdbS with pleckstrin-like domain